MGKRPCIWLTRPQGDSEILAEELARQEIDAIVAPVMRIESRALPEELPAMPEALLVTSRHAVPMLGALPEAWRSLPVFCVGAATGSAVYAVGFTNITEGESDVLDLLPRVAGSLQAGMRVLYLAGVETRVDVATLLAAKQIQVETMIAYEAQAETELSREVIAALKNNTLSGVVFFSPRSALTAAALLGSHSVAAVDAYCLSLAVAQAAGGLAWRSMHACHSPTVEAMLHLIVSRCVSNVV